jgi:hypothetical protein
LQAYALASTVTEIDQNVDDLVTLSGVAENSTDLGTFTGDVLTDNITVKAALQEIETALEGHLPVIVEVHNPAAGTLSKGTAVHVTGTHTSGKPTVAAADANGAGTYPAVGLVFKDIGAGVDGFVIISGFLDGLDTDTPGWNAGDALYVDTTPGDLTTTRPTATSTKVALVARRHATAGSVILIGAGRTNDVPNELTTLTGVALDDSDLGTFTGGVITANSDIKTALQELETDVAANNLKVTNVTTNLGASVTPTTVTVTSSDGTDAQIDAATAIDAGVMTASDKSKLNGIAAGAEPNVNADWNASGNDAEILNKPTIPSSIDDLSDVDTTTAAPTTGQPGQPVWRRPVV